MKTKVMYLATKITVAVILVAILAAKAIAGEAPKLKLVPHSTDRAIVVIDNDESSPSELVIEDLNGNILYYKEGRINEKMYTKLFDFRNLEDGTYKITASNSYGKKELRFRVDGDAVEVEKEEFTANQAYMQVDGDVLKLSFLNRSLNEVNLTISNEDGEIYNKSLGSDFSITTGFNLEKLNYGDYAAVLTDGKNTYSYNFER